MEAIALSKQFFRGGGGLSRRARVRHGRLLVRPAGMRGSCVRGAAPGTRGAGGAGSRSRGGAGPDPGSAGRAGSAGGSSGNHFGARGRSAAAHGGGGPRPGRWHPGTARGPPGAFGAVTARPAPRARLCCADMSSSAPHDGQICLQRAVFLEGRLVCVLAGE